VDAVLEVTGGRSTSRPAHATLGALLLLAAVLALSACTAAPAPESGAAQESSAADAARSSPTEVGVTCRVDADCAVKDVGNCCGYYPACVNKDSPTFPEQVKAQCEASGTASICGFREIASCACNDGRCEATDDSLR
jgi:hypothetical protein